MSKQVMTQAGEPVAYWNGGTGIIPAADVSYLPNWYDYYYIPLYAAPSIPAGWQPIETAPKDGARVLLARIASRGLCGVADGYCVSGGIWVWPYIKKEPTHWMPLSAAPSE